MALFHLAPLCCYSSPNPNIPSKMCTTGPGTMAVHPGEEPSLVCSRHGSYSIEENINTEVEQKSAKTTTPPSIAPNSPPPRPPKVLAGEPDVRSVDRSDMLVVSADQLREIMRQEIANVLQHPIPQDGYGSNTDAAASPPLPLASTPSVAGTFPKTYDQFDSRTLSGISNGQGPAQAATSLQPSLSDEKWGVLFDGTGSPTKRANELLKSIADHIVLEYEPQQSIVITPEKMSRFYDRHRLPQEIYPFTKIFDTSITTSFVHDRIADLYDDLGCQYHLTQKDARSRPSVPALTPKGFARWLLVNMQAYPNEEFQRLSDVVLATPINITNTHDGKLERMPRKISRHTLPRKPDTNARKLLDEALDDFIEETVPVSPSKPAHLGLSPTAPSFTGRGLHNPEPSSNSTVLRYTPKSLNPGQEIVGSLASSPTEYSSSSYWTRQAHGGEQRGTGHHSLPVGAGSQAQLPPPPVGNTIHRSSDSRRYSHSAVAVTQGKPLVGGSSQAPHLRDTSSFLSIPGTYSPSSVESALPTLSAAQLATIRDRSPRREREKQYYGASKQMTNSLALIESKSGDATPRRSGSYRRAEPRQERDWDRRQGEAPESPSSLQRRPMEAPGIDDTRGGPTWDEYLLQRDT
ncbi:uncharacterized protein PgNI_07568 [Pyricularia grisea]|uniref:DUF7514 domain-containing protein n=1 Tax=Pyricularia grisea TaxID=148305 RepID=A0A6P8B1Y1_PYRGI|nr:uncharacterized protein PgNI_07568 [Pyricularia grisea]TLD08910.1 hypothetical protein PgNI_07568 [Pyricularia grisea]